MTNPATKEPDMVQIPRQLLSQVYSLAMKDCLRNARNEYAEDLKQVQQILRAKQ